MSSILTNEEKISIIGQHLRNLEFLKYNAYLDLLQAQAGNASEDSLLQVQDRQSEIESKIKVLEEEKLSLEQSGE